MNRACQILSSLAFPLILASALPACGAPPPQPAPALPRSGGGSASPLSRFRLLEDTPDSGVAEERLAGPLPVDTSRFERIPLPAGAPELVTVTGRAEDDVWMVAKGGSVLRWDGTHTSPQGTPQCFADTCCGKLVDCARSPARCGSRSKPCAAGGDNCAKQVEFTQIQLKSDEVIVSAVVDTGGLTSNSVDAHLRNGRWSCEQYVGDGLIRPGTEEIRVGDTSLELESPAYFVNPIGGFSVLFQGRRLSLPNDGDLGGDGGLAARTIDDLWLWAGEHLWRGNGLAWVPVPTGFGTVTHVWTTDPSGVWALGVADKEGSEEIIRWDIPKGTRTRFSTPGVTGVLQSIGSTFWLVADKTYYHWDGRALNRVDTPVASPSTWLGKSGAIWVVGAEPHPETQGKTNGAIAPGAAFRLVPANEAKR